MGILSTFEKTEEGMRRLFRRAFGKRTTPPPMDVRYEILKQVESKIILESGEKLFPFGKITIQLRPTVGSLHQDSESLFLEEGTLKTDIRQRLIDLQVRYPEDLEITTETPKSSSSAPGQTFQNPLFKLNFIRLSELRRSEIPETSLVILRGLAEQKAYRIRKANILVGRLSEVMDREGRMVRKNDVVFLDDGNDVNSSVTPAHARIWFDFERREFRIMDEGSRYGTCIVRNGRSVEMPDGDPTGVCLQSGDEIYFGQAGVRFEITPL